MQQITLKANGLTHPALKIGDGKQLAILLHGFPDTPYSFAGLMQQLAGEGYTCIAPWLRGYTEQNTPASLTGNATVQIADVAEDITALVDAAGFKEALLIGHDWGAITAYAAANLAPAKFKALVTLSVPHLKIFLKNLWKNPAQLMQSWYIFFFQLRFGIPEARVAENDFRFIESLWEKWSPALRVPEQIGHVKQAFANPQILKNALAYYRGLMSPQMTELATFNRSRELSFANVKIPTLTLTGFADGCILPDMFEGMHTVIDNEFVLRILPQVGHFLPLESGERIAVEAVKFGGEIRGVA